MSFQIQLIAPWISPKVVDARVKMLAASCAQNSRFSPGQEKYGVRQVHGTSDLILQPRDHTAERLDPMRSEELEDFEIPPPTPRWDAYQSWMSAPPQKPPTPPQTVQVPQLPQPRPIWDSYPLPRWRNIYVYDPPTTEPPEAQPRSQQPAPKPPFTNPKVICYLKKTRIS